ncbi:MAG: hypothetical protein AAFZ15_21790 [Bacteroidota bacterium]
MNKTILKATYIFSLLFSCQLLSAQHRVAIYKIDYSELKSGLSSDVNRINAQNLKSVTDQIISFYTNDDRFVVIDKANYDLIKSEQERQKSEDFIDGYIVEQGKQEGADYIFYTKYLRKEKTLSLRIYDVATGDVFCESEQELDLILGVIKDARSKTYHLLNKLNSECFGLFFSVVRSLDKKAGPKTKTLLIAMGRNHKIKESHEVEIFRIAKEKVGEKELNREEVIGKAKVEEVEDANFSQVKVTKGGEQIASHLKNNEQLYCRIIVD